ncbi:hypothetical protein EJP67_16645 [Variovorax guangxiensis]|uniref:Uncharacterized protein n=1 Tax=Variovorax guangxiensis TaxID=1775474 RepID=A0A3S0XGD0_9BURK|nr:hypothetical protein [Variovorax guangxiensis]RUR68692.1 hypothetical protein EJP67_16645 [Variovorax guangxiensis]
MTNQLIRNGYSYTVPEVPYQPARPAYWSTESRTAVRVGPPNTSKGAWVTTTDPVTGRTSTVWDPNYPVNLSPLTPYTYTVEVFHPATAEVIGSPAFAVDVPPQGWTSFAHSIEAARGGARITYVVPQAVMGAVVGVTREASAPPAGYGHILHGLLFNTGSVRSLTGTFLTSYLSSDEFQMDVAAGGLATYRKNGTPFASEASAVPPGADLFMAAALFSSGDSIDEPSIAVYSSGGIVGTMPGAQGLLSETSTTAQFVTEMPAAVGFLGVGNGIRATLPALAGFLADADTAQIAGEMPPLEGAMYGGTPVIDSNNKIIGTMPAAAGAMNVLSGQVFTSTAAAPAPSGFLSDHDGGQILGVAPAAVGTLGVESATMRYLLDGIVFDVPMLATALNQADAWDSFGFDVLMTGTTVDVADMRDAFGFDIPMSIAGGVEIVDIRDGFIFDVPLTTPGSGLEVHAVNMAGYGSTSYANYGFNSFARIGDRYYGAKLGGLFLLEGDSDAGAPIQAAICPGQLDFGSSQEKTIAEAFAGVASEGRMVLKVALLDDEFLYEAESCSKQLRQHRFKLGKGLKANYLTPVLYNQNGEDFEIDSLEFSVATLSRKTRP